MYMVDLLGRSGLLEEAYEFAKRHAVGTRCGIWGLLGACAVHRDVKLGQRVANFLVDTASDIGAHQLLVSNLYAASCKWNCVDKVINEEARQNSFFQQRKQITFAIIGFSFTLEK